ncbi:hypothetical protein [Streptomyces sp. NRRL S-1521]|uniref:hypothetical protein n=1 Tax=Streptomyces sp. NRRL S-1521 TaxID=1609100 RepID=UPI00074969D8|nr:hypothetical protein [Streptomyces sp. NRRL S-1521]KUL52755.1 hypothetical protein ADL30_22600 [Streptomyces sp. NRRL S-1521]
MIHHSHDTGAATRPRLLPWSTSDGRPCYLVGDGTGHVSRVADRVESVQLGMADQILAHAGDLAGDPTATAPQLRYLAARLAESLRDVSRIARSRGDRLPGARNGGDFGKEREA